VRGLEEEGGFAGRVRFEIIGAEETAERGDEIVAFGFGDARHGFALLAADGSTLGTLPGHAFGREEIVALIEGGLAVGD